MPETCSQCGTEGVGFKRCSVCKEATYCGAGCQQAGWKKHKKTCAPPVPLTIVLDKVRQAGARLLKGRDVPRYDPSADWREVLKWEGRLPELMATAEDVNCDFFLQAFKTAHLLGRDSKGGRSGPDSPGDFRDGESHHSVSIHSLDERRVELLGKLDRFRDQGELMCKVGDHLHTWWGRNAESAAYYQKARAVGEKHGFFSVECLACLGLGRLARFESPSTLNPETLNPEP